MQCANNAKFLAIQNQATIVDVEDFFDRWHCLLTKSTEMRPHIIRRKLLSQIPGIWESIVKRQARNDVAILY